MMDLHPDGTLNVEEYPDEVCRTQSWFNWKYLIAFLLIPDRAYFASTWTKLMVKAHTGFFWSEISQDFPDRENNMLDDTLYIQIKML